MAPSYGSICLGLLWGLDLTHQLHIFLELTGGASVMVVFGLYSFMASLIPRPQMLQKNSRVLMTVVIIMSDLYHSNTTGFKRLGEGGLALVVSGANLSAFHS